MRPFGAAPGEGSTRGGGLSLLLPLLLLFAARIPVTFTRVGVDGGGGNGRLDEVGTLKKLDGKNIFAFFFRI